MKLKLQFLIAAVFVMMVYIPAVHGQAHIVFSGGGGTQLSTTLQQSVRYRITNSLCSPASTVPLFVFDEAGNPFLNTFPSATSTITFSVNGGPLQPMPRINSGFQGVEATVNDIYVLPFQPAQFFSNDVIILNAGTITTNDNVAAQKPTDGIFTTFITNQNGVRCSENGVSAGTTAASVSISGRVLTNSRRGLSNALVYLTDSEGNTRTARTNSLGYYRFNDIAAGQSVTITVVSKRYQFAPQVLNLNEERNGVNFLADN